jgi:aspartyl-tRNA(Asn)/glutamyl-tRNA(Gln) amidotransferase subunit A
MDVISGHDPKDSTSSQLPPANFSVPEKLPEGLKIGLPLEYLGEGLDPQIKSFWIL